MRLTYLFSCILLSCSLFAQENPQGDLLNTRQKFFTLKGAKMSIGLGGDLGVNGLHRFLGNLPEDLKIKNDSVSGPSFYTGTLYMDVNSPNSRLSFAFGGEYNSLNFLVKNKVFSDENNITVTQIQIPFFFKYRMGKKFAGINTLILFGGAYNIPITYKNKYNQTLKSDDVKVVQPTYSIMSGLAFQFNFRGKEKETANIPVVIDNVQITRIVYPRLWIFIKGTGMMSNLFNTQYSQEIIDFSDNSELDYRDLRYTIGLAMFFGSERKHQVK